METIHLRVDSKIYDHVIWLLKQFKPNDVQIVSEGYLSARAELNETLLRIDSGEMEVISLEKFEADTDDYLKRYED